MNFLKYVFGPKMYMEYNVTPQKMYEAGGLERFGDQILSTLSLMWSIGYYTSPLIVTFLYRRGYFVADSISSLAKFTTSIGIIVFISLCMRGIGRSQSRSYTRMIKALELSKAQRNSEESKRALRQFDMEFRAWQVDFDVNSLQGDDKKRAMKTSSSNRDARPFRLATLPCEIIAYVAIHTFGIRMIYPGSVKLLQSYMRPMLISGRAKLIEEDHAKRYKVKTSDQNEIDTIFIDNREKSENGRTLVVCSEGNAGFYEIGIMGTPIELKYSVLGWNHPGFEGSTGSPYPDQDKNAIDAVMQFAIHHLGFAVDEIILYGWSIGGYSSLWAAMCYPEVKGVVLDATFDDVLQLAQPRMPATLSGIVKIAIRNYCNLNNTELLLDYNGPVLLIRRTEDEIIADDNRLDTNRGNYLALTLFKYRYPNIFKTPQLTRIKNLLSKPIEAKNFATANDDLCMSRLITYASDQGKAFPMQIGDDYTEDVCFQMAEFLLRKHFRDYKSTHCTPLPKEYFNIPWDIPIEQDFAFLLLIGLIGSSKIPLLDAMDNKVTAALELKRNMATECPPNASGKKGNSHEACDENQFMLQLARLYITSPERIVLLLTTESTPETCHDIADVLRRINATLTSCQALPPDNLYTKLTNGLNYYNQFICQHDDRITKKHINDYHNCLRELREDLIDCEGPADWFEKSNKTIVCPFYNDIINCNYIKAAMLCGLTPALMLRTFSHEVLKLVVKHDCKVSRSLPYVEDPMPSKTVKIQIAFLDVEVYILLFIFLLVCTILLLRLCRR